MNMKLNTLVGAVALAIVAGQAQAQINDGSLGNGELFLTVYDDTDVHVSYTRDLGITINNFLASGSTAPVNGSSFSFNPAATPATGAGNVLTPGYSLSFGADTLFTSTFASALASNMVWNIGALDTVGTQRFLTTSNDDLTAVAAASTNNDLTNLGAAAAYLGGVNAMGSHGANSTVNGSNKATPADGVFAYGANFGRDWLTNAAGNLAFDSSAQVGNNLKFWMLNTVLVDGDPVTATAYSNAVWNLGTNGVLTYSVTPVPEPETWGMFGAGILAVGALARRRMSA